MQSIFLKIRHFERGLSKSLKIVNFIFSFKPSPFYWTELSKTKGAGTSNQSLFRLWKKLKNIPLFIIYYLTKFDHVVWSSFWVIPRTASANLCKSIDDIINYSTSICPFESGNGGKEGKKIQKFEYLENKKSFLDEIKNIFYNSFQRAIIWWKSKNLIKNSGHRL